MVKPEVRNLLDSMQANGELPLVEMHVLRSVGPTLLNRDFNNQIKKITYGGSTRARFSPQSVFRAIVNYRKSTGLDDIQSRMLPEFIAREITSRGEEFTELAENVRAAMGEATNQVLVYSMHDVKEIASVICDSYIKDPDSFSKDYKKNIEAINGQLEERAKVRAVDDRVALKGRMSTDTKFVDTIESAVSINHAYSVDEWAGDVDCFTATDDATKMLMFFGDEDNVSEAEDFDVNGSAFLETQDLAANTYYQYANIDTRTLLENTLRGVDVSNERAVKNAVDRMHRIATDFIEDFALIIPDAKQHSAASKPMPICMLITTKKWARALSADREFEKAIDARGMNSVADIAKSRLIKFANDAQDGAFATDGLEKIYWLDDNAGEIPDNAEKTSLRDVKNTLFAR